MTLYAGMDIGHYPGLALMTPLQTTTNLAWTGLYLDSPMPVPGEDPNSTMRCAQNMVYCGHNRSGNPVGRWMQVYGTELQPNGWGVLPIYWGHQDIGNSQGPWDLRPNIAVANAQDAADKAKSAGLPPNCAIYLDWEYGGLSSQGRTYCKTWFIALSDLGYRPGLYAHPAPALELRKTFPGLFVWIVHPQIFTNPQTTLTGTLDSILPIRFKTPHPKNSGDPDAVAWQWAFVHPPAGTQNSPWPAGIMGLPRDLDLDSALVGDPSQPERRVQPGEVTRGYVSATIASASEIQVLRVLNGSLTQDFHEPGSDFEAAQVITHAGTLVHPWVRPAVIKQTTPAGGTEEHIITIARSDAGGTPDDDWKLALFRKNGDDWLDEGILSLGSAKADPLAGVAATSRNTGIQEGFFVRQDSGELSVLTKQPKGQSLLTVPTAAPFHPHKPSGLVALSRMQGLTDVFMIGASDHRLYTTWSTNPGNWPNAAIRIGKPSLTVHPLSHFTAISREPTIIDVFTIARENNSGDWLLYNTWWNQQMGGWWDITLKDHSQPIGGTNVHPHPLGRVVAVSRLPHVIDVFVIGRDDGLLYNSFWDGSAQNPQWSAFRAVGGSAVSLATVDAAITRSANNIDVIVTGRDENVYVTNRKAGADYRALQHLFLLDG